MRSHENQERVAGATFKSPEFAEKKGARHDDGNEAMELEQLLLLGDTDPKVAAKEKN
jgi:hypothetical protein